MRNTLLLCLGLLYCLSLVAQKEISAFPFKAKPYFNGIDFGQSGDETADRLIFFPGRFVFHLLYLDDTLGLQRHQKVLVEDKELWDVQQIGFINHPDSVLIFYRSKSGNNIRSLILNKRKGSLTRGALNIVLPAERDLIRIFTDDSLFTLVQLDKNSSQIYFDRSRDGKTLESDSFRLPYKKFYQQLKESGNTYVPLLNMSYGNSLVTNDSPTRLYYENQKWSLSVDNFHQGFAEVISFDLEADSFSVLSRPFPSFRPVDKKQQLHSFRYGPYDLVSCFNESGLNIDIYPVAQLEPLQSYRVPNLASLKNYFPDLIAYDGKTLTFAREHEFFEELATSLSLSVLPSDQGHLWLTLGAYDLSTLGEKLAMSLFADSSFDNDASKEEYAQRESYLLLSESTQNFFLPGSELETASQLLNRKYYYTVAQLDPVNGEISVLADSSLSSNAPPTAWIKLKAFLLEQQISLEKIHKHVRGRILFPYDGGWVYGYCFHKEYHFHYFAD